jgi:hypothetical protein
MNLFSRIFPAFLATVLVLTKTSTAQVTDSDSSYYHTAVNNLISIYYQSTGDQSRLYNGPVNSGYNYTFKSGHPYFLDPNPMKGSIFYDGFFYDNVQLQYDEITDAVIFLDSSHRLQLIKDKIARFTISGHHFVHLYKDSLNKTLPSPGFYELLHKGKTMLIKKQKKSVRESTSAGEGIQRFAESKTTYLLKKGGQYYYVKNKKSLLRLLNDRKKELSGFIRSNKLSFRKDPDNAFQKTTAFYDQEEK